MSNASDVTGSRKCKQVEISRSLLVMIFASQKLEKTPQMAKHIMQYNDDVQISLHQKPVASRLTHSN